MALGRSSGIPLKAGLYSKDAAEVPFSDSMLEMPFTVYPGCGVSGDCLLLPKDIVLAGSGRCASCLGPAELLLPPAAVPMLLMTLVVSAKEEGVGAWRM